MQNRINLTQEWAADMAALRTAALGIAGLAFDTSRCDEILAIILVHYCEAGRHYHGTSHLQALFALFQTHAPQPAGSPARLAVWWHDVIYDPMSGDNEANSADMARLHLAQLNAPGPLIERVCALILATKNHFLAPSFGVDDVFMDADIAILGAPAPIYRRYSDQVRAEYAMVPTDRFNAGRSNFLRGATTLPRLFRTDVFQSAFGDQAHTNMNWELTQLT